MNNRDKNKLKPGEEKTSGDDEFEEMEVDNDSSDDQLPDGAIIDHTNSSTGSSYGHDHRRRVKIKKRIRVKKKTSSKRKYKKLIERIIWIAFIAGFVAVIYILINQLGLFDDKYKGTKKRTMMLKLHNSNGETFCIITNKQNRHTSVNSI